MNKHFLKFYILALTMVLNVGTLYASEIDNARALAKAVAPIKSASELKNYLAMTPIKSSPLRYLQPVDRKIFVDAITFNEKGVTGFNYRVLTNSLTREQTRQILALIGKQHMVENLFQNNGGENATSLMAYTEYKDYYCESKGNCKRSGGQTCDSATC